MQPVSSFRSLGLLTGLGFALGLLFAEALHAETRIVAVGGTEGRWPSATLGQLTQRLAALDASQTVVLFTGNYARRGEMPGKNHPKRRAVERDVRRHVDAVRDFAERGGRVYFLPGHRDYAARGRKGVRRLRKYLNHAFRALVPPREEKLDVMPQASCGVPTVLELGDGVVLALLNTQWWLQDFSADARSNEDCAFKSRAQLSAAFLGLAKKYRTQRLVIAGHHPIESLGRFGGNFPIKDHFWPPVAGSLAVWARQSGLVPQYRGHPMYDSLVSMLFGTAQKFGRFVFLSGHERNLQWLHKGKQLQVISGSSAGTATEVGSPEAGEFVAARAGWVELQLGVPEGAQVTFYEGLHGRRLVRRALPPLQSLAAENPPAPAAPTPGSKQSTYAKRDPGHAGFLRRFFLGEHYREAHTLKLDFAQLLLAETAGGLRPLKIGGGNQTNSLRLVDPSGGQWALRSTSKDPSRFLPYPMNQIPALNRLLEDWFTSTHPAAALAIPPMAAAVGIYHARPRLMYLPDQAALAPFRGYISDEVVLLERRPKKPKQGELPAHLGGGASPHGPTRYRSTVDMLGKLAAKPWKHRVDQEMMLRARLFDLFVGDWDRHEDQWRFARIPQADGSTLYRPVPRDRDQAFANYDGALLVVGRLTLPELRKLRPFSEDYGNLEWLAYNARFIDPVLLNGLSRETWMRVAQEVQAALSDEVIAAGLRRWSRKAYALDGLRIEKVLRARRDALLRVAWAFYAQINRDVEVVASEADDRIDLYYQADGRLRVELRRDKKGAATYFARDFDAATETLSLYALGGRDQLRVHGPPHDRIRVHFVGGAGKDKVRAAGDVPVDASHLAVYDRPKGLKVASSIRVDDRRSHSSYRNHYDRYDPHHEPLRIGGLPSFQMNPDDGVYLGGTMQLTVPGFKRRPFASSHALRAFFATATLGADVGYVGTFPETLGVLDQTVELSATTPTATRNFFGFTNAFVDPGAQGRNFFRVRQMQLRASYGVAWRYPFAGLRLGLRADAIVVDTEATTGRFVLQSPDVAPELLEARYFAGGTALASVQTLDNPAYPKRGVAAELSASLRSDLTPGNRRVGTSGSFAAALATHLPLSRSQRFVLSSRVRTEGIVGNFPFYFAPTLGDQELRAFNAEQLAGNGVFAQSTDLRVELLRFRRVLPSALGLAASVDHGLAFGPSVASGGSYHLSLGGSVFWAILDTIGLSVGYYRGIEDGQRLVIGFGPLFSTTGASG